MGFVSEELNETEKQLIKDGKASKMAVVYGKEASIWKVRPAGPQTPSPTLGPQEAPNPQPWKVETAPTSGQNRNAIGNTGQGLLPHSPPCLPPLPASTLCNKFKRLHPPPLLGWIHKHSNSPKGFRLHVGILGGGRQGRNKRGLGIGPQLQGKVPPRSTVCVGRYRSPGH